MKWGDEMGARKAKFSICDDDRFYIGYTSGDLWNGWACPYFTLEVGKQMCADFTDDDYECYRFFYDEDTDTFFKHDVEENEFIIIGSSCNVMTVDGELKLYDIGAFNWVWDEYPLYERKWAMDISSIARILYNMSLDMDYMDHIEFAKEEISGIELGLRNLEENRYECLLCALENIALKNEHLEFWYNERLEKK